MNDQVTVPKLDLAPKRTRPLSLWNPLDYLLLLYWVFLFPQALGWYVDTFGGGDKLDEQTNWQNKLEFLRQNHVQLQLCIQGLILTIITPLVSCLILKQLGIPVNWTDVAIGVAIGVAGEVAFGITEGVAVSVAGGIAVGVAVGVAFGVDFGANFGIAGSVTEGLVGGVAFGVAFSAIRGVTGDVAESVARGVAFGLAIGVAIGVAGGVAVNLAKGVARGITFAIAFIFAIMRSENWLLGSPKYLQTKQNNWLISRITLLPLPYINLRLQDWLRQDWQLGLHNINQLLQYTQQSTPAINAVNQVLAEIPNQQVILSVSHLVEKPFDWDLVHFSSASLNDELKSKFIDGLFIIPNLWKTSIQNRFNTQLRIDTHPHATVAGFWYLHEKNPNKAKEAFDVVRSLLYGEEMYTLANTLVLCQEVKLPINIANLQLADFPLNQDITKLLRPTTWQAINSLKRVIEDAKLASQEVSRSARSLALNRALGKLLDIIDNQNQLPEAERNLIVDIAQTWKDSLESLTKEIGDITITKPVSNPYTIGNPVLGDKFVGREDIMRQLEELWVMNASLQSVVIFGHRRMGKTSILRNFRAGSQAKLVYLNLQGLGELEQGLGEVFLSICDEIAEVTQVSPPDDEDLLAFPQRTFTKYLKQVIKSLGNQRLIIALDEFETIEELIEAGQIPSNFMAYLRTLVQMSPQLAFALAGLHTLEEMTADYFQPFYASVIPIKVGFLNPAATRQILANPVPPQSTIQESDEVREFLLDYTPESLDCIHSLTSGQPYLVQLVGFQLVRLYNDYVFEQGNTRNPVFTVEDITTVVRNPEFFKTGRYYFQGVWRQAGYGEKGQQEIIKLLASHREGLTKEELRAAIPNINLDGALATLERHDVIEERENRVRIIVELFRIWVEQNKL